MSAQTLPRFLLFYLFTLFPFYSFTLLLFNYSSSSNTLLAQSLALPQSALCPYGISRPFCMIYRGSYSCKYSDFSVSTNVLPNKLLWLDDPRRLIRASASTVTSIRVGRYEHPRRSIRASASVVTSIRVGRYEHPRRSTRMGITKVFWGN